MELLRRQGDEREESDGQKLVAIATEERRRGHLLTSPLLFFSSPWQLRVLDRSMSSSLCPSSVYNSRSL